MNGKFKIIGLAIFAVAMLAIGMGAFSAPISQVVDNEPNQVHNDVNPVVEQSINEKGYVGMKPDDVKMSHSGQAEAIAPAVVGGAVVAVNAGFVGAGIGYSVNEYFDESDINKSEVNSVLREQVHDSAITSEGTNQGYYDNIDNDLSTIEGTTLQEVNSALLQEADNLTSESETLVTAENSASESLWTRQTNLVETHNFHSYDLKKNMLESLDQANASDDYYVASTTNLDSSGRSEEVAYSNIVNVEENTTIGNIQNGGEYEENLVLNLNGNTLEYDGVLTTPRFFDAKGGSNITIKNGKLNTPSELIKVDSGDLNLNMINVSINQTSVSVDNQGTGNINIYDPEDVVSSNNEVSEKISFEPAKYTDVTLDPADVNSPEAEISFTHNNNTANLTGINVSVDSSYSDAEEAPLQVAVPYVPDGSGGYQPMKYDNYDNTYGFYNDSKLYINTPSSGIQDRSEPVEFDSVINTINTRDGVSSTVYSTVQTHASNLWTDTISTIANDDNVSKTDYDNVTEDLSLYNVDSVDANDTDSVVASYSGLYDSVADTSGTRLNLTEEYNGNNTTYKEVVLFSGDLQTLLDQTTDNTTLETGDVLDVSSVKAFVIDPEDGKRYELQGSVTVDAIKQDGSDVNSTNVRTLDLTSTDLSELAISLEQSNEATEDLVDSLGNDGNNIALPDLGFGQTGNLFIYLILAGGTLIMVGRRF